VSHTNSPARTNLNSGAYSMMSNVDYAKNITRKKIPENLQTRSKVWNTHTTLLPSPTTPTNSYPPWHTEGADVLDTKILYLTE